MIAAAIRSGQIAKSSGSTFAFRECKNFSAN
jgi:hypothetical protein